MHYKFECIFSMHSLMHLQIEQLELLVLLNLAFEIIATFSQFIQYVYIFKKLFFKAMDFYSKEL